MNWKSIFFRGLCLGLFAYAGGLAAASLAPETRDALGPTRFPIYLAANLVLAVVAGYRFFRPSQWYMVAALIMVLAMAGSLSTLRFTDLVEVTEGDTHVKIWVW